MTIEGSTSYVANGIDIGQSYFVILMFMKAIFHKLV